MADLSIVLFDSVVFPAQGFPELELPLISQKYKGCGFYSSTLGTHTAMYSTTNQFIGVIKMQATLVADPVEGDWFSVDATRMGDGINFLPDQSVVFSFKGNFVWVRCIVTDFTAGNINRVLYSHN